MTPLPWWLRACVVSLALVVPICAAAQTGAQLLPTPVRERPTVAWATTLRFRDWGGIVRAGGLVIGSNSSGTGGLFAIDEATGKLRWQVTTSEKTRQAPVSDGKVVVVPWTTHPSTLAAYDVATGKRLWQTSFDPVDEGRPVIVDGLVIAQHEDGSVRALDLATGAERWKLQYARKANWCAAGTPAISDGVLYISSGLQPPATPKSDYFLHAIDVRSGQELWRYNPQSLYPNNYGACLVEVLTAGETVVAVSDEFLFGVDRATGRQKYRIEIKDGARGARLRGLVHAKGMVFGVTAASLWAIDASTGRTVWKLAGDLSEATPGTAVADGVVYVQGKALGAAPATSGDGSGVLYAVDVETRSVLWGFAYPTAEPWSFDTPLAGDREIYVSTYKALLKLR